MNKWYELTTPIRTYNPKGDWVPDNTKLSRNLSPLTNFFLNVFVNSLERRNLIVAIPDNVLRPIPIISYLYADLKNKCVLVFTQKGGRHIIDNPMLAHNRNYHLLNSRHGDYLFGNIPVGFMSDGGADAKVYLPRAKRSVKQKFVQQQKDNFLEKDNPKVLLYYDENNNRIVDTIEKITLDGGRLDGCDIGINLGLVIFENADRFAHSQYTTQSFLKWISLLLKKRINLLFHFANPESKFIQTIKEETNSLVIPFRHSLLRGNVEIKKASMEYFNRKKTAQEYPFLQKYNIDRPYFYEETRNIEILEPSLESGNIDYHFKTARKLLKKIDEEKLVNKRLYFRIKGLLFKLHNITINPSKYKESYSDDVLGYKHYTIPCFLQMLRERLPEEDNKNRVFLEGLRSEIYCMYSELKECKRYGEEGSYTRVAKEYKIMELFNKISSNQNNRKKVILATYSPFERNILEEEINKLGLKNGFEVKAIKQINRSTFAKSDATLILPGPLRMKYMSELLRPYKKIIILTYNGENYNIAKKQIDSFDIYSFKQETNSMLYLGELYEFLGIRKDGLFKDYYDRAKSIESKLEQRPFEPITHEETEEKIDVIDRIKKIVSVDPKYADYRKYDEEVTNIENTITKLKEEQTENEKSKLGVCYEVSLRKVDNTFVDNTSLIKKLPIEKTYLYLEDIEGEVQEGTPRNLKPGYFIVILDNDERKTLLELIIEIFDLEECVDKHLIESWKERLMGFIERSNLSYEKVYQLYSNNGGQRAYSTVLNWAKGTIIGPRYPNDILIIGKIINDEQLIENYKIIEREVRALRDLHRRIGRKLRKIIKKILKDEVDPTKLSYEESELYEKIKGGLYEIIDVMKRNSNGDDDR